MTWVKRGRDFWSDSTGRFDVFEGRDEWIAIDWERGQLSRWEIVVYARVWCDLRAKTIPTTFGGKRGQATRSTG